MISKLDGLTPEEASGLIPIREAAKSIRGAGDKPACVASLRRWAKRGYRPKGKAEPWVVLRCVRLGLALLTHPKWVREFEAARTEAGMNGCELDANSVK